jgi:hypothetical protein
VNSSNSAPRASEKVTASSPAASTGAPATSPALARDSNTLEDDFSRANGTGFGYSTDAHHIPSFQWAEQLQWAPIAQGQGPYEFISGNAGLFEFSRQKHPAVYAPILAIPSQREFAGGDALAEFSFSTTRGIGFILAFDVCPDGSCDYDAVVNPDTAQVAINTRFRWNRVSLAGTMSKPFATRPGVRYWVRVNYNPAGKTMSMWLWQDGSAEPTAPALAYSYRNLPAANAMYQGLPASDYQGLTAGYVGVGGWVDEDIAFADQPAVAMYYYAFSADPAKRARSA